MPLNVPRDILWGTVIRSFRDAETEAVFLRRYSRRWNAAERSARRKLDQLHAALSLTDLASPPGNRLEALRGDRAGFYSIRINDQLRICFRWDEGNAYDVEIVDYH